MNINLEIINSIGSIIIPFIITGWIIYNEKQRDKERKSDLQKEFLLNFYKTEIKPIIDYHESIKFDWSESAIKELIEIIHSLYYNLTCLKLSSKDMFFFDKITSIVTLFSPFVDKYGSYNDKASDFEKIKISHLAGDLLQVSKLLYGMMTIDEVYVMIFQDVHKTLHETMEDIIQSCK